MARAAKGERGIKTKWVTAAGSRPQREWNKRDTKKIIEQEKDCVQGGRKIPSYKHKY